MAKIEFTDAVGAATLDNGLTAIALGVGSRFANWVPMTRPVGPSKNSLGTGVMTMFRFRTDYGASFELREIPIANVGIADRLRSWLLQGGTCSVTTGDTSAHVYPTCCLMPGAEPQITQESSVELTFVMSLALINVAASPVQMLCTYS